MKRNKEFRQIDLTGKVYGEFDLDEIYEPKINIKPDFSNPHWGVWFKPYESLKDYLKKAKRGDCIKFTGQTYLMKVTD